MSIHRKITLIVVSLVILQSMAAEPRNTIGYCSVDVYTNKGGQGIGNSNGGTYLVNEVITLYIELSCDSTSSVLTIYKPDGTSIPYERVAKSAGTYQISNTATFSGRRKVVVITNWNDGTSSDELYFDVAGLEPTTIHTTTQTQTQITTQTQISTQTQTYITTQTIEKTLTEDKIAYSGSQWTTPIVTILAVAFLLFFGIFFYTRRRTETISARRDKKTVDEETKDWD